VARARRLIVAAAAALVATTIAPARSGAQASVPAPFWIQPELRADLLAAHATSAQLGAALSIPLGLYVRGSLAAGAGTAWHDGRTDAAGRVDATARFLLDPFRERRWGPYGLAGGSVRHQADRWRPYLLIGIGVEGPANHGFVPALELAMGGGVRVGLAIRRAIPDRR
jgi:hypothetical protein